MENSTVKQYNSSDEENFDVSKYCSFCQANATGTDVELSSTVLTRRKLLVAGLFATIAVVADEIIGSTEKAIAAPWVGGSVTTDGVPPSGPSGGIWGPLQEEIKQTGKLYLPNINIRGVNPQVAADAWSNHSSITVLVGPGTPTIRMITGGPGPWGFFDGMTLSITMSPPDNRVADVMIHEVGHVLSLHHSSSLNSIMNPEQKGPLVPSEIDYEALVNAFGPPGEGQVPKENSSPNKDKTGAEVGAGDKTEEYLSGEFVPFADDVDLTGMENYKTYKEYEAALDGLVDIQSIQDVENEKERSALADNLAYRNAKNDTKTTSVGTAISLVGLITVLYGLMLGSLAIFDKFNNLIKVRTVPVVTFGKISIDDGEDNDTMLVKVLGIALAIILCGILIATGTATHIISSILDALTK